MKFGNGEELELDAIDLHIVATLQGDCKISLARLGEVVGLSSPAVIERIKKLEQSGVIRGYHAVLDGRALGLDITAFIGVSIDLPRGIEEFERAVQGFDEVLECHHVTGHHTLLLKVKTESTSSLEQLIRRIRSGPGVSRTETMVVLSTAAERVQVPLPTVAPGEAPARRRGRVVKDDGVRAGSPPAPRGEPARADLRSAKHA